MKSFELASRMDLRIEDGSWRLYKETSELTPTLIFEFKNGGSVLRYHGDYGEYVGLPGNSMSTASVQAVVVGYKASDLQWLLGLHIAENSNVKPTWVQLAAWKRAQNTRFAAEAQEAGRILAEYIGCPLKIFGVKKMPNVPHTGPLEKHDRQDIDRDTVEMRASQLMNPGEYLDMKIEDRPDGLTLKVGKNAANAVKEAPAYNSVDFDSKKEVIKMIPPTGLLGTFFGGARGREIPFRMVRNVELRYVINYESKVEEDENDELLTEQMTTLYEWRVYLTVPSESILIAATGHRGTSELSRQRTSTGKTGRLGYSGNVNYYRKLNEDQAAMNKAREWAEKAAYIIAALIGCRLVETQLGDEIS